MASSLHDTCVVPFYSLILKAGGGVSGRRHQVLYPLFRASLMGSVATP
ncbi:MAG TPA: hypothetical protein VM598_05160 [Bdellovibrionota bacterium]|nr:hypothetical protein [Bdellovibrionota bacterium]